MEEQLSEHDVGRPPGTALACLAVLAGTPPEEAVRWVRAAYCPDAVETIEQARLVETFGV